MSFEILCTLLFMALVLWVAVSAFYTGYQRRNRIRDILKDQAYSDSAEGDDTLLNSDGRPDM